MLQQQIDDTLTYLTDKIMSVEKSLDDSIEAVETRADVFMLT